VQIPDFLKCASVIPLYKGKGSTLDADNFRPISLLSPLAKIFEVVIFNKLQPLIDSKLCPQQHGFRRHHSTHSAHTQFSQDIWNALDKPNGRVGAIFIDLKKAFNTVQKEILLHKLAFRFNLPPSLVKMISDFLSLRTFTIKIGNFVSKAFPEANSVPQGSTLGPLLFAAFIDDICESVDLPFLLYADDIVIYCQGSDPQEIVDKLNLTLVKVNEWCSRNGVSINLDKTFFQFFHKTRDTPPTFTNPSLNNQELSRVEHFKYLGITYDSYFSFRKHFSLVKNRLSSVIGRMNSIAKFLPPSTFSILFKAFVIPVYYFGLDIWGIQPKLEIMKLQNLINNLLFSSYHPSLGRKLRRSFLKGNRATRTLLYKYKDNLKVTPMLNQLNILTISERLQWICLKNVFKNLTSPSEPSRYQLSPRNARSFPLLVVPTGRTKFVGNSVLFRSVSLWNSLPRNWDFDTMTLKLFKKIVFYHLVSKRSETFVKF